MSELRRENQKVKAWEQQEGEPLLWWHRFMKYFVSMEAGKRSILGALRGWAEDENYEFVDDKDFHAKDMAWNRKAKRFNWVKRAALYDDDVYRQRMESELEEIKEMFSRQAQIGRDMQKLAMVKLRDEFLEIQKTGRPLIDMAEARLLFKEGISIERQARGLPDYLLAVANLSDEELMSRYERLLGEVAEIEGDESLGIGDGEEGDETPAINQQETPQLPENILE